MVINFHSCILVILPDGRYQTAFTFFQFCFNEVVFPSFLNAVITFKTVLLATPNNSSVFVTLAPAIQAPTI